MTAQIVAALTLGGAWGGFLVFRARGFAEAGMRRDRVVRHGRTAPAAASPRAWFDAIARHGRRR